RSYGSTERRVLTDVQLPLARPAIMTGLNQTLLLAISMLGIAALMGAGGLGKLLLRAINSQNLPLAASGGLAFFLVAVVLDRISQREHDDGMNLLARIREAWVYRADPEGLLEAQAERSAATEAAAIVEAAAKAELESQAGVEAPAPVSPRERLGLLLAVGGGIVAAASAFLPWGIDAGLVSSWGRRDDEIGLLGTSSLGIEASGGSIFAIIVILFGLLAAAAALRPMFGQMDGISRNLNRLQGVIFITLAAGAVLVWLLNMLDVGFGPLSNIGLVLFAIAFAAIGFDTWARGAPRLGADGAMIAALAAFGGAVGYVLLQPSAFVEQYSHGIGAYLAVAATAVAVVGAGIAATAAPYAPRRPLKLTLNAGMMIGAVAAVAIIGVGTYSAWLIDERLDSLITPEMQAEIDRLQAEAADDINKQIANGQEITNMINLAQAQDAPVRSALDGDGPRLGWPLLGFGLIALIGALFAGGIMPTNERARWLGGIVAAGAGLAAVAVPAGWIFSFTRSGEPRAITGAGSMIALAGAFILFSIGRSVVGEFQRRKVYSDSPTMSESVNSEESPTEEAVDHGLVGS
ncbi:MAG: ABC transporter permease subunit, partial [Actinomycetota bacterium]